MLQQLTPRPARPVSSLLVPHAISWKAYPGEVQQMRAVAIKKGQSREQAAGLQEMGTLRCEGCGEEFVIGHDLASVDKWLADKQAHWLERVLAEEHEREKKHPDRIELPD